jgi:drug/metabolite transporter (DMT)-like permease
MSLPVAPIEERRVFAIGLVLITFLLFTLTDTAAKWLVEGGMAPMQAAFLRYAIHLALIAGFFLPRHGLSLLQTKSLPTQLVRAVALMMSTLLNFIAIQYLPLTLTGSIVFTMPLIVCALSGPLLGEKVGLRRWIAILVGFAGVMIIVRPGNLDFHWAVFLSFGSVSSAALYFILTRKLSGRDSTVTMQLYAGIVGTLALLPFALANWSWPSGFSGWLAFFGVGLAAMVGHQISIIAHRFAPASTLAPFAYVQIIYMTASSWLIFSDPPDIWLFVGAPIVVGSGLFIWLRERQLAKRIPAPISVQEVDLADADERLSPPRR